MKNPLIVKQYEDTNLLAQMFQSCNAVEEIADTFVDIIDKIIIDVYLKDNVFLVDKEFLSMQEEAKKEFVLEKRKEILKKMITLPFELEDYIISPETSFKMTSCVKCCCLGIREKGYDQDESNKSSVYCGRCIHKQDDYMGL